MMGYVDVPRDRVGREALSPAMAVSSSWRLYPRTVEYWCHLVPCDSSRLMVRQAYLREASHGTDSRTD